MDGLCDSGACDPGRPSPYGFGLGHAVAEMQRQVGAGLVIANNAYRGTYFPQAKGVMFEGWAADNIKTAELWIGLLRNASERGMLAEVHTKCPPNIHNVAGFLVAAGANSYFGCGAWHETSATGGPRWYDIYDRPLGAPSGLAKVVNRVWTRSFASGTTVKFDLAAHSATIHWADGVLMRSEGPGDTKTYR